MNPTHYAIYKKQAALQMKFIPPKPNPDNMFDITQGFVMLEFAKPFASTGKFRSYDWKNRISMKLNARDIAQILINSKRKPDGVNLIHDPNAGTDKAGKIFKTLTLKKGQKAGTFFMSIFFADKGEVSVPIDAYEFVIVSLLLKSVIPKLYGW